ncbi:hypothetical protein GCM10011517_00630 [Actibacterium pelagium]|uniref:Uncharacterized protein n=1 Tax=Actibacterium pelagium TaxID=2029103 RepID=A0A917A968_9RHOB|nr:hypothetical protein GCM10011517_00630 [Actibacterium pelagium]
MGVVVALFGFVGGVISVPITIALTFSVWILGAVLVDLYCAPPDD